MPIILVSQEAEIRRILVQSQPGQIVHPRPYLEKNHHKQKVWWSGSSCRPRVQTLSKKREREREKGLLLKVVTLLTLLITITLWESF
jgi:hypothetical protein